MRLVTITPPGPIDELTDLADRILVLETHSWSRIEDLLREAIDGMEGTSE